MKSGSDPVQLINGCSIPPVAEHRVEVMFNPTQKDCELKLAAALDQRLRVQIRLLRQPGLKRLMGLIEHLPAFLEHVLPRLLQAP
ncbi:MAG: hypothetical protein BWY82_02964 [Verrucomicrobia bacterium ADurb.Bin474]|nr:MAG: hypothetical protein BWY82_02964 [Verrucomicrobia bacterium ADurb.Bin474]